MALYSWYNNKEIATHCSNAEAIDTTTANKLKAKHDHMWPTATVVQDEPQHSEFQKTVINITLDPVYSHSN